MSYLFKINIFYLLFVFTKCNSERKICSMHTRGCYCPQQSWLTCRNIKGFPDGHSIPNTTLFFNFAYNEIGPTLQPEEIFKLTNHSVKILDVSHNQIAFIEDCAFKPLGELATLDISFNKITVFTEYTFSGLKTLVYFYGNNMELRYIHTSSFNSTPALQYINLEYNNLTYIGKEFSTLLDLTTLLLAHNQIRNVNDGAFSKMSSLFHLSLYQNDLTTPNLEWFYLILQNKGMIELRKKSNSSLIYPNPWICCSNLLIYRQFVLSLNFNSFNFGQLNILCSKPTKLANRTISSLSNHELNSTSCSKIHSTTIRKYHEMLLVEQDHTNFLYDLTDLQLLFVLLACIFACCALVGLAGYIVIRFKYKDQEDEPDISKSLLNKSKRKVSTRPFRQDPPTYGMTDHVSRKQSRSRSLSFYPRLSPRPPAIEVNSKPLEQVDEFDFSNFTVDVDQSEDEPWSVVERKENFTGNTSTAK